MTTSPIMRYFDHRHLKPGPLRDISKEFTEMAEKLESFLPAGPEKSTALRKLLESKDSAVRAALDLTSPEERAERTEDGEGASEGGGNNLSPEQNYPGDREMDRPRGRSKLRVDRDPVNHDIVVNMNHPSLGDQVVRGISDIEMARLRRAQSHRAHGYTN